MATLEAIQEKIKKLQAQADALIAKKAQAAVDHIRKLMIEHGLTTEEIEAAAKAKREGKLLKSASPKGKPGPKPKAANSKPTPKYQDKKTGATWSGMGRAPAWIANAKDRTKFLIAADAPTKEASTAKPAAKKVAAKKAAAKKVAAKKVVAKKAPAKAPAAKKAAAKRATAKKVAVKKAVVTPPPTETPAVVAPT